jgi:hypothetical protein
MESKRVELTKEEWTIMQMTLEDYDMSNLSKSEQTGLKIIFEKIDFQIRGGFRCFHEYGKINETWQVCAETREQPAEYESDAVCLICGDTVSSEDIQNIVE